jgi:hypothetical protein
MLSLASHDFTFSRGHKDNWCTRTSQALSKSVVARETLSINRSHVRSRHQNSQDLSRITNKTVPRPDLTTLGRD